MGSVGYQTIECPKPYALVYLADGMDQMRILRLPTGNRCVSLLPGGAPNHKDVLYKGLPREFRATLNSLDEEGISGTGVGFRLHKPQTIRFRPALYLDGHEMKLLVSIFSHPLFRTDRKSVV